MTGYDSLARFIGQHSEYSVYRRYEAENAKRLLYMQAEIRHLSHDLDIISQEDRTSPATSKFHYSWLALSEAEPTDGAALQYQISCKLSEKLELYYKALLQTDQISRLSRPRLSTLNFLRDWLERESGGNCFLSGVESEAYDVERTDDLLTLSSQAARDPFAQFLGDKLVPFWHRRVGHFTKPSHDNDLGKLWV